MSRPFTADFFFLPVSTQTKVVKINKGKPPQNEVRRPEGRTALQVRASVVSHFRPV